MNLCGDLNPKTRLNPSKSYCSSILDMISNLVITNRPFFASHVWFFHWISRFSFGTLDSSMAPLRRSNRVRNQIARPSSQPISSMRINLLYDSNSSEEILTVTTHSQQSGITQRKKGESSSQTNLPIPPKPEEPTELSQVEYKRLICILRSAKHQSCTT